MANVSPAMVKDLREKTGSGMMDCKNALNETGGDIEAAVDWLRKKGLSKAAKKSGRVAAEGLVAAAVDVTRGVLVEVNSETDFVARNADFQRLVRDIADVALEHGGDVAALGGAPFPSGGTVSEALNSAIATVGENMTLRRAASLTVPEGLVGHYVHGAMGEGLGKIGVIVGLQSTGDASALAGIGRQVAMHVAALSPIALDAASLDPATVAREKQVMAEKAANDPKNAGKPANILDRIVESGLKSYFKEVCLLDQSFIHDSAKTVAQAVRDAETSVGAPVKITGFVRFALGEGVERPDAPDFASEVASMV